MVLASLWPTTAQAPPAFAGGRGSKSWSVRVTSALGQTFHVTAAVLGAIITILSLGYEPFILQVVTYPVQQSNSTTSDATAITALGIDLAALSGSLQNY